MAEEPNPTIMSYTQPTIATVAQTNPNPSSTEAKRSRRKKPQKDASIRELTPETTRPPTNTTLPIKGEKKRKTNAPLASNTPPLSCSDTIQPQYLSLGTIALPAHRRKLPTSDDVPVPCYNHSLPLQLGAFDLDTIISKANTSLFISSLTQFPTVISLKDRLITVKVYGIKINANSAEMSNPIDKYTRDTMPNVYYGHLMAALDFIDIDLVGNWENLPDGKLLAHPFEHNVRFMESHPEIKANIFATVVEITQSETVGICSPHLCPSTTGTLIVFLIYNISKLYQQILLKREVWSSTDFTFCATSLNPVCLNYLFGITNLTSDYPKSNPNRVIYLWAPRDK
jgi:hypothetical protein